MSEKTNSKDLLSERFWRNVTIALIVQEKTFSWLEKTAGIPANLTRSSKSNGYSVRLANALKISKVLGFELGELLHCEYRLVEAEQ